MVILTTPSQVDQPKYKDFGFNFPKLKTLKKPTRVELSNSEVLVYYAAAKNAISRKDARGIGFNP